MAFYWVEPVLGNEDKVSFSRKNHRAPGEIRTRDLAIKSPVLGPDSLVVRASASGAVGRGFALRPRHTKGG